MVLNNKFRLKVAPALVTNEGKAVFAGLEQFIKQRLDVYKQRSITRIATFLDSRFRRLGFQSSANLDKAKQDVVDLVNKELRDGKHDANAGSTVVNLCICKFIQFSL